MFKLDLEKAEETRSNCQHLLDHRKSKRIPENIYFCFTDYTKAFDSGSQPIVDNSSRDGYTRPPDLPPEKSVCRSRNNSWNWTQNNRWFQIGKGVHQGCILSPCLFNLYAEYIMRNARLDEAQAGIKIVRRIINNLRYANDTTLTTEREEELKSLLMKV